MSEYISPWGTPTEVLPAPNANEASPFHQETVAEVLPEQKRTFGKRILDMFARKPESVVGDMSASLDAVGKLPNYHADGLDNLSDGGVQATGQYDQSREGLLTALRDEADIEGAQRSVDPFSPDAQAELTSLRVKQGEAEAATLAAAQNAEMRRGA